MKKFLLSLFLLLTAVVSRAEDFEVDGIYYKITSTEEQTVAVTSGTNKYVGCVVIPETIAYDGVTYSVTTIGERAFYGYSDLTAVTTPDGVTKIGYRAFSLRIHEL